jgi:hypothetical protein
MIRTFVVASILFLLAVAGPSEASPLAIEVVQTEFSIELSNTVLQGGVPVSVARSSVSASAFEDHLTSEGALGGGFVSTADAAASADLFDISATTRGTLFGGATANVESRVTFRPLAAGVQTVGFDFVGDHEWYFSSGRVALFNTTTSQESWSYTWDFRGQGTVPWREQIADPSLPRATAQFTIETLFSTSNVYQLTMQARTGADSDSQRITMDVSGLKPTSVPEPNVLLLFGGTAAAVLVISRRRVARSQPEHLRKVPVQHLPGDDENVRRHSTGDTRR